jgi:hypothetical protein
VGILDYLRGADRRARQPSVHPAASSSRTKRQHANTKPTRSANTSGCGTPRSSPSWRGTRSPDAMTEHESLVEHEAGHAVTGLLIGLNPYSVSAPPLPSAEYARDSSTKRQWPRHNSSCQPRLSLACTIS